MNRANYQGRASILSCVTLNVRGRFGRWVITLAFLALLAPCCSASLLYTFQVLAQTDGVILTGINGGPSLNEEGLVAFSATVPGGQSIFANTGPFGVIQNITPGPGWVSAKRSFNYFVKINDSSQVAAQDLDQMASPSISTIRTWSATTPDSFTIVDQSGSTYGSLVVPTINNVGQVAYLGIGGSFALFSKGPSGSFHMTVSGIVRPMIADNGSIVGQEGTSSTSPIRLYTSNLTSFQDIADSTMGFSFLDSLPGVSASGTIVVFQGNRGNGRGIFASVDQGDGTRTTLHIAGENMVPHPELGTDDSGNNLYLSSFPTFARVGVIHQQLGAVGLADDCFIVCFSGTPNLASCSSSPAFFSNTNGIWTVQVNITTNSAGQFQYNVGPPKPVVQVGDTIGGQKITFLSILDPIARALTDSLGNPRTDIRGDHRIAFTASTETGAMVVMADHFAILHGFDLSSDSVNWQPLADSRMEFLLQDAWGGRTRFVNAANTLILAKGNNIPTAAYLLLNYDRANQDGLWQVRQALSAIGSARPNLAFLAVDVEYGVTGQSYTYMQPAQRALEISNAVVAIKNYGLKPVIYTRQGAGGDWGAITGNDRSSFFGQIPLWLQYPNHDGQDNLIDNAHYIPSPPWTTMSGKQYIVETSLCEIQGVGATDANLDLDVFDPTLFDSNNLPAPLPKTGCATDYTPQITYKKSALRAYGSGNPAIASYNQSINIENTGTSIPGDVSLVVTDLTQSMAWLDLDEITSCSSPGMPPLGSPFKTVLAAPAFFASGGSIVVGLQFVGLSPTKLNYNIQVLGGTGIR